MISQNDSIGSDLAMTGIYRIKITEHSAISTIDAVGIMLGP
jgi:hypothetical protein